MNPNPQNTLPLGDFKPSDQWQTHINFIFYGTLGPAIHNHFQTYVSRDYRLAHTLAEDYYQKALASPTKATRFIQEWGVGNGNLAASFLTRLKALDTGEQVYPFTHYTLCDYSKEILKGVRRNPGLLQHKGRFSTVQVDANHLDCFQPQCLDKIISNEIWDDLATKVLLKHEGTVYEEYLQPQLDPALVDADFHSLQGWFNDKNLQELQAHASLLPAVAWERSFQRVDISDWPYHEAIAEQLNQCGDEIPLPINTGAFTTLKRAHQLLKPGSQGYTGFDYGMFGLDALNQEGRPYFNLYGGQYTFMVNFDLLARVGKAIGFGQVDKEYQDRYVGRQLDSPVVSLVELVQNHPQVTEMAPWDRDILMLQTIHAVNTSYRSPYKNKLEYPPMDGTPKKQRKLIAQLAQKLNPYGVPDTVAYVTESEVLQAAKPLRKLGYRERDLKRVFHSSPPAIAFTAIHFR